jgi:RNA polymerase sigma-70 factor, ECF subfamily
MRAQAPQIAPVGTADAELVRRARGRDEAAIRLILQSNNRRLYRIARGILRNDSEAEDVVQETYVRAFTHLENFRGDSSLATWLARIAMNEALGRLRRQRPGVEWTSLPPGTLEAQIIQFPLRPHPWTRKNPWHNVKSSMSSSTRSTSYPTPFALFSSPA